MRSSSLRDAADTAHGRFCSARAELLRAVADLAKTEDWRGDGAGNLASWLCARLQISMRTARELVRDAHALVERPALGSALRSGAISVDQCKALTTLCEPNTDDDEVWLENLPFWSLPELEREARKKVARELERRDDGVYLRLQHTRDERYMRGEFQVHPEDGAALLGAVEALIPKDTPLRDWDRTSARALVELAKGAGRSDARPLVMLSVSADALAASEGVGELGSGGLVPIDTAQRLVCDARTQIVYKDLEGKLVAVGSMTRTVPPAMRRAVEERDGGTCTFPGCEIDVYLDCHHIVPAAKDGPTVPENLQLVCWIHHDLVHEKKWSLRGEAGQHATWIRPDGTPFEPRVRVTLDTC